MSIRKTIIALFLLCSFPIVGMEEEHFTQVPSEDMEVQEDSTQGVPLEGVESDKDPKARCSKTDDFPEATRGLMVFPDQLTLKEKKRYEKYFETLPGNLQRMVKSLQESEDLDEQDRVIILHGPPSAGKTEGCKAIAHTLHWPYICFDAPTFGTSYQNSAVQNIQSVVEPILKVNKPCVIIFDEITALTKGAQGEGNSQTRTHRNDEQYKTSCGLNTLLDKIRRHQHVLFLGTTNHLELITKPIQERSRLIRCESSVNARIAKFKDELMENGTIDSQTQTYLDSIKDKIANFTFRDIDQLIKTIKQISRGRQNHSGDKLVITTKDIETALREIESEIEVVKKEESKKTEQQIMHEESIALQKKQHEQNAERQTEAALFGLAAMASPGLALLLYIFKPNA